jgi:hypothetical protein
MIAGDESAFASLAERHRRELYIPSGATSEDGS